MTEEQSGIDRIGCKIREEAEKELIEIEKEAEIRERNEEKKEGSMNLTLLFHWIIFAIYILANSLVDNFIKKTPKGGNGYEYNTVSIFLTTNIIIGLGAWFMHGFQHPFKNLKIAVTRI